jgi:CubicO group peptidase (beta-lactamase class C family)
MPPRSTLPEPDQAPPLVPLPTQPHGVPFPTASWPTRAADDPELDRLVEDLFTDPAPADLGHTHALAVVNRGELVVDRQGVWFESELSQLAGGPTGPIGPDETHLSWSMAKSVLQSVCGMLALDGRFDVTDHPHVPAWGSDDPRAAITWDDLLLMRSGLQWFEEYYDLEEGAMPDVVTMLYDPEASKDMAAFASGFPLISVPGAAESYNYSSGTTNIAAAAAQRIIGGGEAGMRAFLQERLFDPLGMTSADPRFDDAGTFVASSYLYATARDYARFGLLQLRDGVWDGQRLLPEGWVDYGRTPRSVADDDEHLYCAHWWADGDAQGTWMADGFEGQRITMVPATDTIVVRLGKTHTDLTVNLDAHLMKIAARFA